MTWRSIVHRGIVLATGLMSSLVAVAAGTVEAVWKPQRVTFVYVGHTTFYTCGALEQKLTVVLRVLGAHEDIEVDRRDCKAHGPTRLHVRFRSPIEATPENLQALTSYGPEQAMIARLRGIELPSATDLARFPASSQQVSFSNDRRLRMSAADCEFVDHVRRQVVPHLSAQVLANRIFCTPGRHAVRAPRLIVSALVAHRE